MSREEVTNPVSDRVNNSASALTRDRIACCTLNSGMVSLAYLPRLAARFRKSGPKMQRTRPHVAPKVVDAGERLRARPALEEIIVGACG